MYDVICLTDPSTTHLALQPEHRTVIMPLRTLEGKVNANASAYLMVPSNAKYQVNAAKFIASYLQGRYADPADYLSMYLDFCEFPEEGAKERYDQLIEETSFCVSEDFADTVWDMYIDRGEICFPDYWKGHIQSLRDNYMKGFCTTDELLADVESRREIYLSE